MGSWLHPFRVEVREAFDVVQDRAQVTREQIRFVVAELETRQSGDPFNLFACDPLHTNQTNGLPPRGRWLGRRARSPAAAAARLSC